MEIRDIIHGVIEVHPIEERVLQSRPLTRLQCIKQQGFSEFSYPGATHNRFIHSVGAMHLASRAFVKVFGKIQLSLDSFESLHRLIRLGALLHDVGHGPLSHTSEFAMPMVSKLKIPVSGFSGLKRQATHEDYTLKIILDSELTDLLDEVGSAYGFGAQEIASLMDPRLPIDSRFFSHNLLGETIDFKPILSQLISSELDCDRMDYLLRDSAYCGVSYGRFDPEWLLSHLGMTLKKKKAYLHLNQRAIYTFENFLLSRFHMFLMVYFHHKSVIYEAMLEKYLKSRSCEYKLPTEVSEYLETQDSELTSVMTKSSNKWAQRIIQRRPLVLLFETSGGQPLHAKEKILMQDLVGFLEKQRIEFVEVTSTSTFAKSFTDKRAPIFVRHDNRLNQEVLEYPLQKGVDLFDSYPQKRSLSRVYVDPSKKSEIQSKFKFML